MADNSAAADYFLKIDGVTGESTKKGFTDQIEIESFSFGESQGSAHSTGTGGGAGKVSMSDFSFTARMSKASPVLFLKCAMGEHPATAVLTARKQGGGQQVYLTWTMSEVTVSSYNTGGSNGGDAIPIETFALAFKKIQVEYKPQKADGSMGAAVTAGYDLGAMDKV
jgi:type VI secretion system secreted protein Hcp